MTDDRVTRYVVSFSPTAHDPLLFEVVSNHAGLEIVRFAIGKALPHEVKIVEAMVCGRPLFPFELPVPASVLGDFENIVWVSKARRPRWNTGELLRMRFEGGAPMGMAIICQKPPVVEKPNE